MLPTNRPLTHPSNLMTAEVLSLEDPTQRLVTTIVQAADDRKAADILALKVTEVSFLADYFILASGFSRTQVRAIADSIEEKVATTWHRHPTQVEGKGENNWIVLDYGEVIAHIMLPTEREFYNLEAFWGHAVRVDLPPELF
ncbi:ribosome silencing factor [Spirulina subsalsa FACHB-351]|uniref:Ribosomal silencing factor RsfS n=1 Tax=Spirulina subsalsa FACHB-351 TaxID=234711 RepID=A0ABT3L283_9CYAN|nr:ribosome silencing factor [Spirulina subsalsa]MCW6035588.1 ribosome silencing factor [Spirulina subsalsa FACHB-351]